MRRRAPWLSSPCARSRGCGRCASTSATRRCGRGAGAMSNMRGNITLTPTAAGGGRSLPLDLHQRGAGAAVLHRHRLDPAAAVARRLSRDRRARRASAGSSSPGVYLASEGGVELGLYREPLLAEPLGRRRVPGLEDDGDAATAGWRSTRRGRWRRSSIAEGELRVQGRLVLGRTVGLGFSSQRSARFPRNFISGQRRLRVFGGTGQGAGLLDALLERAHVPADDRHQHRGLALRVSAGPLTPPPGPGASGGLSALARGAGRVAEAFIEVDQRAGGRPARFARPSAIVAARELGEVPAALAALDRALAGGAWIAGFASYELGYAFEPRLAPLLPAGRRLPLLAFGVFGPPGPAAPAAPGGSLGPFRPAWDAGAYGAAFERVADYIRAGDIYQANLTMPLRGRWERRRRRRSRRGWRRGSRWGTGRWWRCRGRRSCRARRSSSSRSTGAGGIEARPMKGTARAGRGPGARRRAGGGAGAGREEPGGEPDDRRPPAQRHLADRRDRVGAGAGALRGGELCDGAPDGVAGDRAAAAGDAAVARSSRRSFPAGR